MIKLWEFNTFVFDLITKWFHHGTVWLEIVTNWFNDVTNWFNDVTNWLNSRVFHTVTKRLANQKQQNRQQQQARINPSTRTLASTRVVICWWQLLHWICSGSCPNIFSGSVVIVIGTNVSIFSSLLSDVWRSELGWAGWAACVCWPISVVIGHIGGRAPLTALHTAGQGWWRSHPFHLSQNWPSNHLLTIVLFLLGTGQCRWCGYFNSIELNYASTMSQILSQ